jgi:Ni/Fe-hydrogenase subunit HybB-like protein
VYDVFFVPFSAGAFMILAITHIYNRKEYHAIARPVVLAGFLGEVMVIAVLVMDLGRWHQFYNVLFPWYWNIRSFMFQVSICLTIYMGVMLLEIAPTVLERFRWQKPLRFIKMTTILIAGAGIVLSSLHQSSLGSLFLLMPYKLHPLWWTPLLPLLFFTSAALAGLSMAIFVAGICMRVFGCDMKLNLLSNLARVVAVLLGLYLLLKMMDLILAGEMGLIFSQGWLSLLFLAELTVGVIVPLVMFSIRRTRESSRGLISGAACVLSGLALNRTSVALVAQQAPAGASYFPSWMEIVISVAAVAAGILLFVLAVRFLPILPEEVRGRQSSLYPQWSRRAVVFVGGALSLVTVAVVLLLQPMTQARASKSLTTATSTQIQSPQRASCLPCHQDSVALEASGATADKLPLLTIEPQPPETPHGRLDCVTCHYGDGTTEDLEAAHDGIMSDPTKGEARLCQACHSDLPQVFPQDRLRTPHDAVTHGQMADVSCSDCHGGVGHGFDPVSGDIICPMGVCIDCHVTRQLDSELTDCAACHITAHEPAPAMRCNACHQSTEVWTEMKAAAHSLDLTGGHSEVECLDCHGGLTLEEEYHCADCHQPPGRTHYSGRCEDCHTPANFKDAQLSDHPVALVGAHQNVACASCHAEGHPSPKYICSDCHQRPENHLPGPCNICHTPEGWASSVALVVNLAPQIPHGVDGQGDCLMCHAMAGGIKPIPSNHDDYAGEQCTLCHKAKP